jgi:hypothetical protein
MDKRLQILLLPLVSLLGGVSYLFDCRLLFHLWALLLLFLLLFFLVLLVFELIVITIKLFDGGDERGIVFFVFLILASLSSNKSRWSIGWITIGSRRGNEVRQLPLQRP